MYLTFNVYQCIDNNNFSHSSTTWTRSLQQQYSNRAGKKRTFLPAQGMGESRVTNWNLPSSWTHTLTNTELESLVERPPTGTHPEHQAQRVEPSSNFALENLRNQTQWAGWQMSKQRLTRTSPLQSFTGRVGWEKKTGVITNFSQNGVRTYKVGTKTSWTAVDMNMRELLLFLPTIPTTWELLTQFNDVNTFTSTAVQQQSRQKTNLFTCPRHGGEQGHKLEPSFQLNTHTHQHWTWKPGRTTTHWNSSGTSTKSRTFL